ncbi:MAG TPA: acyltransferase [Roseiarcus sp.]
MTSLALRNLRAVLILVLVSFHSCIAYLGSTKTPASSFDHPPFRWLAYPIVDSRRWYGFDVYCIWVDLHLMALMFFLSGLFVAPSLARKGNLRFARERLLRLGTPFLFSLFVLIPIAIYPAYRLLAPDPGLRAYAQAYVALPFLPNGPTWFLWLLLAFSIAATLVFRVRPGVLAALGRLASSADARPGRFFFGLLIAGACGYIPLALALDPWGWFERGPFTFQYSRLLLYVVYFAAGVSVGACGIERGLLAPHGRLARLWPRLAASSALGFVVWLGLAAATVMVPTFAPAPMRFLFAASYALACACGVCLMLAAAMRFGAVKSKTLDLLSSNTLGIYVLHYAPVVWMQYALMDVPLPAICKALIVFLIVLPATLGAAVLMRQTRFTALLIGEIADRGRPVAISRRLDSSMG